MSEPGQHAERDIDERARVDASLEVERRSIFTTFVVVTVAVLFTFAAASSPASARVFDTALAVLAPIAALRMLVFAYARRLAPGSPERLRAVFAPLLVLVAAWGAFAAWGAVAAQGTPLDAVIVSTQCLCSAAVVMSYAPMPRLAIANIVVTVAPTALAVIGLAEGLDRITGFGALMFSPRARASSKRRATPRSRPRP
jgi:hypothetical protein